jgi:two-component system sensor histidine kinase PilS (NtrC family)
VLLGAFVAIEIYSQKKFLTTALTLFYASIILSYLFTIVSAVAIKFQWIENLRAVSYIQLLWDVLFCSFLIIISGGIESPFPIYYYVAIVMSSILLYRAGSFKIASLCSFAYGAILDLQYFEHISYIQILFKPGGIYASHEYLNKLSLNIFSFFIIAYLSSYLAAQLAEARSRLSEKVIDLNKLKHLNEKIVSHMSTGLVTLNQEGRITFINNTFTTLTQWTFEKVVDQPFADLFHFPLSQILHPVEFNAPWSHQSEFITRDGKKKVFGFSSIEIQETGIGNEKNIVFIYDLTEFRKMEESMKRQNRLAAVGRLAAGIAHEFRNPLASLSGSAELLQQSTHASEENKKLMSIIIREKDRLNALITNFLNYVETQQTTFEKLDAFHLLKGVVSLSGENGDSSNHFRPINLNLDESFQLKGDRRQMAQVLTNLITNGFEAMPYGGTLSITCKKSTEKQNGIIEVQDTGIGIPKEELHAIFDPFFTTKPGGTGLGLAMVHKIIETHGGTIAVQSERGHGTKFTLTLPLFKE